MSDECSSGGGDGEISGQGDERVQTTLTGQAHNCAHLLVERALVGSVCRQWDLVFVYQLGGAVGGAGDKSVVLVTSHRINTHQRQTRVGVRLVPPAAVRRVQLPASG